MTNENTPEPPVAKSARAKRATNTGYKPGASAPAKASVEIDPTLVAEKKAEQQASREVKAEESKAKAAARKEKLKKNRLWIAIAAIAIVIIGGVAVVETVSANGGSAKSTVDEYVAAMNAKDPSVFSNTKLFPMPTGVQMLPSNLLSQVDTSIVGASTSIKNTADGAEATISASNLKAPIVIDLKKSVQLDGVLMTPHWVVTTPLAIVSFTADSSLPSDAVVTVGTASLGNSTSSDFASVVGKSFASPLGTLKISTAATANTNAASADFVIGQGHNDVAIGGGPVNASAVIAQAIASGDFSTLSKVLANQVETLDAPLYSSSGQLPVTPATMSAADALALIEKETGGATWSSTVDPANQANAKAWLQQYSAGQFAGGNAIWATAPFSSESGMGTSFLTFTLDDSGKISKVWLGINLLQQG